ncbi:MAG TPA: PEP-CTERM sorting domain-containing protein [Allosphingosinicella sp.]|jgi:hypothetical protein|nr:PEP-CTERM sorting domain-containing protein [Allosphingosinicella sp.]
MGRIFAAASFLVLAAAPAAAQEGVASSSTTTSSSSGIIGGMCREIGNTGRVCCDNCGGGYPSANDPVDVPAPPAMLLFAAGAMALAARRRLSAREAGEAASRP